MKKIQEIKSIISDIPNVFYNVPTDEAERSNDPAVRTLLDSERSKGYDAATLYPAQDDMEQDDELCGEGSIARPEEVFEYGAEIDESELVNALGGAKGEEIRKAVLLTKGTDALAWYVTFHARNVNPGIYIPVSSIFYLMVHVFGNLQTDFWTKFKLAFRALHQHELFHFGADYMASQWECITSKPCKRHAKEILTDANRGYSPLEEEMANTQMLHSFRWSKRTLSARGKTEALKSFVRRQPFGYRDALEHNNMKEFDGNCRHLALAYVECIPGFEGRHIEGVDVLNLLPRFPHLDWRYCPIHLIHDERRFGLPAIYLDLILKVAYIEETESFIKRLNKLSKEIQAAWKKIKDLLQKTTLANGLDFKMWERRKDMDIYSVRLNKGFRAHLGYQKHDHSWLALEVGGHKEMGHG